ncbi:hypothetical protein PBCV1_a455R [Paramecium bursaria Chlorella virus 1]|uniref:Uncharacterized protein n=1 Tax=Paramecium bursaria Chlorella virus 1 TaxID=10506 RepID=Q98506_PBCV1|nr:hypothetical protein PBCV1_a455R [Paramecium bursaria Chlorella virus 1]AAC96823.1 hypothetical protein [Paramecium bursaria Chlorella virus 1]
MTRGSAYVGGRIPLIIPSTVVSATGTPLKSEKGRSSSITFSRPLAPDTTVVEALMCSIGFVNSGAFGADCFCLSSVLISSVCFFTASATFASFPALISTGSVTAFTPQFLHTGLENKYFDSETSIVPIIATISSTNIKFIILFIILI